MYYYNPSEEVRVPKLPMRVCNNSNILKEKIFKFFERFDMVRAYIDNVLVITKHDFLDQKKALDKLLQKLA